MPGSVRQVTKLSKQCKQQRYLLTHLTRRLEASGFRSSLVSLWHHWGAAFFHLFVSPSLDVGLHVCACCSWGPASSHVAGLMSVFSAGKKWKKRYQQAFFSHKYEPFIRKQKISCSPPEGFLLCLIA